MFRLYLVINRPSKKQILCIKIYSAFWDHRMHCKFWYIGSVLWKAWWWLNRAETCCHKNILCDKLLCLTEIYTLYESMIPQWGSETPLVTGIHYPPSEGKSRPQRPLVRAAQFATPTEGFFFWSWAIDIKKEANSLSESTSEFGYE
jgi:hypothetical protein